MDGHYSFSTSNCSPYSSEGIASHRSTPDTKLTAFSLEDSRNESKATANSGIKIKLPPAFTLQGSSNKASFYGRSIDPTSIRAHDPFVTTPNDVYDPVVSAIRPKLSPTATSFTPSFRNGQARSIKGSPDIHEYSIPRQRLGASAVSYLNATSVPDTAPQGPNLGADLLTAPHDSLPSPIGPRAFASMSSAILNKESLNVRGCSRYLMISNIVKNVSTTELNEIFTVSIPI